MQLLLAKTALERVKSRLNAIAPDLDIVAVAGADSFERGGAPLAADQVDPDLVWTSLDAISLMPTIMGKVLGGTRVKWNQIFIAGLDMPVWKSIVEKGVRLTKSSAQAVAIAEYVVGNAVSLILPIDRQRALQAEGTWRNTPYREVSQSRWTLIGYGAIGKEIAVRAKAFGVDLTVVRRAAGPPDDFADAVIAQADLPAALPESDVVVLACALNAQTRGMANAAFFAAMKPGAILINIGRGALVDEDALRAGLERDQPGHAVLDVFAVEPLPAEHWMWDHPKVRVTAHTSNAGQGTLARGDTLFLENLKRFLAGEPLLNEASRAEVGL
jgi:phosphoglycerate dehydrogenase-like enzyme